MHNVSFAMVFVGVDPERARNATAASVRPDLVAFLRAITGREEVSDRADAILERFKVHDEPGVLTPYVDGAMGGIRGPFRFAALLAETSEDPDWSHTWTWMGANADIWWPDGSHAAVTFNHDGEAILHTGGTWFPDPANLKAAVGHAMREAGLPEPSFRSFHSTSSCMQSIAGPVGRVETWSPAGPSPQAVPPG